MKSRALLVPRNRGESTRRALTELGALRTDLSIQEEDGRLALPLRADAAVPEGLGEVTEREFEARSDAAPGSYGDHLSWTEADKGHLPRSYDVVGDIVLVRVPPELEGRRFELGEALLKFVPAARLVGADKGVHGTARIREIERIAGSGEWKTRHRENGVELSVDVRKAYFSPRLAREHALVAEAVGQGEAVYDLCCGVGPFSVTIARAGRAGQVTAVDNNPAAIELLNETLARSGWTARVRTVVEDLERFAPGAEPVDRVILNLPREGIKYAPLVARLVRDGGRFHYYEVVARHAIEQRGQQMESTLPPERAWKVRGARVVHPYSPSSDLVGYELERQAV